MTIDMQPVSQDTYASIAASKKEPAWLAQFRAEALTLAGQAELPKLEKTRIDRWNLSGSGTYKAPAPLSSIADLPAELTGLVSINQSENILVQCDSGVVYVNLSPELEREGVILKSLEQAAFDHPELVQQYLMKAVQTSENKLTALHAALWNGGLFLYVPKNVVVQQPIQAIFYSQSAEATFAPHVLIVAESFSSVTFVSDYLSAESEQPLVHYGVTEVFVKPGARVRAAAVHDLKKHVTDLNYRRAVVENDGKIEWIIGELSYGNGMSDTHSILKGNASSTDAKVISVGTGDQRLNFTTRAVHYGKASESAMVTKAVMRDEATAIINGVTKIEHGARKSNGQQTERVLMLSPKARGDANPILLIDEDDVVAGHAASVGKVNEEQVYYLMSRGVPKQEAERLIIYGFLSPVIEEIPLQSVRDQLQAMVERKLER